MGIGVSVFLMAVGAILTFAVEASADGININTVGIILMVVGAIGLVVSLLRGSMVGFSSTRERRTSADGRTVVERDRTSGL